VSRRVRAETLVSRVKLFFVSGLETILSTHSGLDTLVSRVKLFFFSGLETIFLCVTKSIGFPPEPACAHKQLIHKLIKKFSMHC